jgi:hypothetical protein
MFNAILVADFQSQLGYTLVSLVEGKLYRKALQILWGKHGKTHGFP